MRQLNKSSRRCILVFVRAPEKGKVKTRLSGRLDKEIVLNVYKNFALDILSSLKEGRQNVAICYHPPKARAKVIEWLGDDYLFFPQRGAGLGEKMADAMQRAFGESYQQVLLVGTDVPDLPHHIIDEAFEGLERTAAVIGPSLDGGYYLIGFNSDTFLPEIFENMPWSTADVFKKTMEVFKRNGLAVYELPIWRDIDRYEDLVDFMETNADNPGAAPNTVSYLSRIGFPLIKAGGV